MTTRIFGTGSRRVRYLHGGSFIKPDGPADDRFCDQLAREAGCEVGSVDYPLSQPVDVVLRAIATELDKSGPCVLVGTSAGACAALMLRHKNVKAIVAISGCPTFRWAMQLEGRDEKLLAQFLGVHRVRSVTGRKVATSYFPEFRSELPPTLVVHGEKDPRFPIAFVREFVANANLHASLLTNDMDHGIENGFARMAEIKDFVQGVSL